MLIKHPDPMLNEIADPIIDEFRSEELYKLVERMEQTMNQHNANGLAAVQIGINKAVIIYKDKSGAVRALCNPMIIARSGKAKSYGEGCLCKPGHRVDIRRSKIVRIKAQTLDGEDIVFKEKGFPAIILQHEVDHVNGKTIFER